MDDVQDVTCDVCPSNLRWANLIRIVYLRQQPAATSPASRGQVLSHLSSNLGAPQLKSVESEHCRESRTILRERSRGSFIEDGEIIQLRRSYPSRTCGRGHEVVAQIS